MTAILTEQATNGLTGVEPAGSDVRDRVRGVTTRRPENYPNGDSQ
jgi:hypothetical protein